MDKDLDKIEHWDQLDKVVKLYLEGNSIPVIAKQLRLRVRDVQANINEWATYVKNNQSIQKRARESVHFADAAFNKIANELWETVEQADDAGNLNAKNVALKTLSDIEVKRTQMLEKAGLNDTEAMVRQMEETEEKARMISELLKELSEECSHCRPKIMDGLQKIFGKVEPVVIQQVLADD